MKNFFIVFLFIILVFAIYVKNTDIIFFHKSVRLSQCRFDLYFTKFDIHDIDLAFQIRNEHYVYQWQPIYNGEIDGEFLAIDLEN